MKLTLESQLREEELRADILHKLYWESLHKIRSFVREIEYQRLARGGEVWPDPTKPPRKRSVLLDLAGFNKPVPGTLAALAEPYREAEPEQEPEQFGKIIKLRPHGKSRVKRTRTRHQNDARTASGDFSA